MRRGRDIVHQVGEFRCCAATSATTSSGARPCNTRRWWGETSVAEKRTPSDRKQRDILRAADIPEPTGPPITYRNEKVTPGLILRLFREGMSTKKQSRNRILLCRAMRRMEVTSLIRLAPKWARRNPEAASWVVEHLEQRKTLDSDLVSRIGTIEPQFTREALGFTQRDDDNAEAFASYLEEWRLREVPTQIAYRKLVEDGEFASTCIPTPEDMDGIPDFFEYLDEKAYERLDSLQQTDYSPDANDRRGRYRKTKDGKPTVNPQYDRGDNGGAASQQAHKDAVQRYLLHCSASAIRVIPALDCAPIVVRGKGKKRWELSALVERTLYYVSELQDAQYGWQGLGDRKLIPMAYNADGSRMRVLADEVGTANQLNLYTAYLLCRDEDGRKRPIIAYTVGGSSTWDAASGNEDDSESVGMIDLYDRYKLKDGSCPALDGMPLWDYHVGLHSEDDDFDYYAEPYLWRFYHRIHSIEGNKTSINAATTQNAFTGHFYQPDAALAEAAPEAVIEQDGELIVPTMPGPGEMMPAAGPVTPAIQARVGEDAYKTLSLDMGTLQALTAADQAASPAASGSAQIVRSEFYQTSKRDIRDGVLDFVRSVGERQVRIWHAIYQRYGIQWPIQTTQKRPVGQTIHQGRIPLAYNPDWVGDGHFHLACEYPEEANPVAVDLERSLQKDGLSTKEQVFKKNGVKDVPAFKAEILKDRIESSEPYLMAASMRLGQKRGDKELVTIIKGLQQQQKLTVAGVPGAPNGVPMSALNRGPQAMPPPMPPGGGGGQGAPLASAQRGGEKAGALSAANAQQQAQQSLVA